MNKWIAEFELEDGDTMPEHMDLEYKGAKIDFHCRPLEQEPKPGHCRDCKWRKDSDGAYRRGVGAESQCPINRREVFEGNGYCYMFEPQESEET
jgi:hypothetical protein